MKVVERREIEGGRREREERERKRRKVMER